MAKVEMERMHVVDIDQTVKLLLNYDERVQNRSKQRRGSIYMVPSIYRDLSPHSFTPRLVSIGPLHHHDEHLKGFEVQKATYMHHLFHNVLGPIGSTPEQLMKACVTRNPDGHSSTVPKMVKGQSVVELDRLGVRFRAKTYQNPDGHAEWPMAMKIDYSQVLCFPLSWVKPTFEMPALRIHDHSELFIRNLIIYEQSSKVQTCVTSYMLGFKI
ncbi:putative UPF0481 protein [Tanacetum coccineum]